MNLLKGLIKTPKPTKFFTLREIYNFEKRRAANMDKEEKSSKKKFDPKPTAVSFRQISNLLYFSKKLCTSNVEQN